MLQGTLLLSTLEQLDAADEWDALVGNLTTADPADIAYAALLDPHFVYNITVEYSDNSTLWWNTSMGGTTTTTTHKQNATIMDMLTQLQAPNNTEDQLVSIVVNATGLTPTQAMQLVQAAGEVRAIRSVTSTPTTDDEYMYTDDTTSSTTGSADANANEGTDGTSKGAVQGGGVVSSGGVTSIVNGQEGAGTTAMLTSQNGTTAPTGGVSTGLTVNQVQDLLQPGVTSSPTLVPSPAIVPPLPSPIISLPSPILPPPSPILPPPSPILPPPSPILPLSPAIVTNKSTGVWNVSTSVGNITIVTTNATNTVAIINIYTTIDSGSGPNGSASINQGIGASKAGTGVSGVGGGVGSVNGVEGGLGGSAIPGTEVGRGICAVRVYLHILAVCVLLCFEWPDITYHISSTAYQHPHIHITYTSHTYTYTSHTHHIHITHPPPPTANAVPVRSIVANLNPNSNMTDAQLQAILTQALGNTTNATQDTTTTSGVLGDAGGVGGSDAANTSASVSGAGLGGVNSALVGVLGSTQGTGVTFTETV